MKDALKRAAQALGFVAAPARAEVENTAPETLEVLEAPVLEVTTEADAALSTLQAAFDAQGTTLAAALADLTEVKAALADVTAALTAVSEAKELAEAAALATKLAARKASVVAALGTEHADAFMAATQALPDSQFNSVMAAMATSTQLEASTPAFNEVGVDAQADVEALVKESEESGTGAILKAKYQKAAAK